MEEEHILPKSPLSVLRHLNTTLSLTILSCNDTEEVLVATDTALVLSLLFAFEAPDYTHALIEAFVKQGLLPEHVEQVRTRLSESIRLFVESNPIMIVLDKEEVQDADAITG